MVNESKKERKECSESEDPTFLATQVRACGKVQSERDSHLTVVTQQSEQSHHLGGTVARNHWAQNLSITNSTGLRDQRLIDC